ncbi:MAG: DUF2207 domain-containing protein [Bacteroidales bacterium]|nr:DUF2207 domain-containing protein [Bacteroidales bacterium]
MENFSLTSQTRKVLRFRDDRNRAQFHTVNAMKNKHLSRYRIALTLALLLVSLVLTARDYHMSGLDITVSLKPDGSMLVREDREFTFEGRYSEVYRTFPLDGRASFSDFSVYEDGVAYERSDSKQPGTFRLVEKRRHRELQLFFEAHNETRTFSIRFTASGAVDRHEDVAVLYYQLISDEWTKPLHDIRARIVPPVSLDGDQPPHWVHGSLDAVSEILEGGVVELWLDKLPAKKFLEIRALYPEHVFHGMPVQAGAVGDSIREEARVLAEEANRIRLVRLERMERRARMHEAGRPLATFLAFLFAVTGIMLFQKYGKRPPLSQKPETFSGLPSKEPPALVNYLVNGSYLDGNALVSTMFHLAYRGFFRIEENTQTTKVLGFETTTHDNVLVLDRPFWENNKKQLKSYENELLEQFFNTLYGRTDRLNLKKISKKQNRMQNFFIQWKKAVTKEAGKKEWFDADSKKGRNIGLAAGVAGFVVMLGLILPFGLWMLLPAGVAFVLIFASFFIFHRTEAGEIAYRQWRSLKQHLKRYHFESKIKDADAGTVNEYLIYGLALGLGSGFLKKLTRSLEATGHTTYIGWIVLYNSSLSSFGKTLNTVITATGTAMSSAAGMGGGGIAGGGGGAASGGGGAR